MRVVIVGAGEVGYTVAGQMAKEGHDVTVIEWDPLRAEKVESELDVMVIRGNGARPQVLEQAGVSQKSPVDLMIACTEKDEANLLSCWIGKRNGVVKAISRARNLEFTDSESWARELGIDTMISPERSVAREIEELLAVSSALRTVEIAEGRAGVYVFRVAEKAALAGVSLKEFRKRHPELVSIIVFVEREHAGFLPGGDTVLQPGDICYAVSFRNQVWKLEELFGARRRKPLRRVLVVGGGKVGFQVARRLEGNHKNLDIRLMDMDAEKCERLARELERAVVICGDAADRDLLNYEGIGTADGFVTTTASDESNIVLGILGKSLGASKSIAVVRRKAFMQMEKHLAVDALVNPHLSMASAIMQQVRFPRSRGQLSLLDNIGAEMIEGIIPEGSAALGRTIMHLDLPSGIILALVERGKHIFVPWGDTELLPGDRVILFAASDRLSEALDILGV